MHWRAHLKGLSKLQSLNLDGTPITDAGLQYLAALSNLENANAMRTKVTNTGTEKLKKNSSKVFVSVGD